MKLKFNGFLVLLVVLVAQLTFAQERAVSGVVSDNAGLPLPGVSVLVKGTQSGTQTDFDGKFSIRATSSQILIFSYIGMKTQEVMASSATVNVKLAGSAVELEGVVVTALGIKREVKALPYAAQTVKAEQLNVTQSVDVKGALAGKVAGIQINGQAGSKIGATGKIRIRGAISLTGDDDALYVLDGIAVDPNSIDMDNIADVTVLKGPNATALYGQRAVYGVIQLTSKKGVKGRMTVDINSSTTFDKVAYLPKYQNLYGTGYEGNDSWSNFDYAAGGFGGAYPTEWSVMDGKRYLREDNNYADESWGPKFDDKDYLPWYSWSKDSPYFGQTAKYSAQPNNIKDFYDTGVTKRNSFTLSGGGDNFRARLSYTNLDQQGIQPSTGQRKNYIASTMSYDLSDKLKVDFMMNYSTGTIRGEFDDSYSNQTSGSFNSWFGRQLDVTKLRELKDLKNGAGYQATWNWWGPEYYTLGGSYQKPAFWYNPYTYLEQFDYNQKTDNLTFSLSPTYKINDNLSVAGTFSRNQNNYDRKYYFPTELSLSAAPDLYNPWQNAFGIYKSVSTEDNYDARINYNVDFNELKLTTTAGASVRNNAYDRISTEIDQTSRVGGLVLPDVYTFSNASVTPITRPFIYDKSVKSIYALANLGYKNFFYLDGTVRRDWSSAMPSTANGNTTGSIGASLIFTELMGKNDVLSFGKLRAGYAIIGTDANALAINPNYPILNSHPYNSTNVAFFNKQTIVDPNLKFAQNASFEAGLDLKFLSNRISFSATYYNENRKDEIISINVPNSTGSYFFLTNAGETKRSGIELSLSGDVVKASNKDGFNWNTSLNFAQNKTQIVSIREGLSAINGPGGTDDWNLATVTQQEGEEWGQIRGSAIKRDANGTKIVNADGLYEIETNHDFGSVLPDFTGGLYNQISYKGITLAASLDFQKGGKFFSLSETWGTYSGLLEETAALNNNGINVREDVDLANPSKSGGVHVVGVNAIGTAIDTYVSANPYFAQFKGNNIAEPFVHDASYLKLRDVSLSYTFSGARFNNVLQSATVGIVGRNLWLIAVSKDNKNRWDPSELSGGFGENGQLPGTRSLGLNVKLTF
ncbi:SusC/RagA family TonB-linked outer membrane protein [Flavobacterium urumqiense]|uniref:TonB-linked outer membrane protein, SusC/RagA family n=1 Tax=Flavobacterium urumqiense TaxID=935224 RepID=A0A1H5Y889_9FLAO|nr:SusC/RagA family TonB-linked outer membrane protein [Flavobacterium urumqiense]SEG20211.1 TonB-linked outer membrane protein, SusC/RagA family [Flavobacterium urumqiense]